MNRNNNPHRRSVQRILQQRLREDKRSDSQIARDAQVSQPTVSRLRGGTKHRMRSSEPFNKLCIMYGLVEAQKAAGAPDYNVLLQAALAAAWDGTPDAGRNLLALIEAVSHLIQRSPCRTRRSRGCD